MLHAWHAVIAYVFSPLFFAIVVASAAWLRVQGKDPDKYIPELLKTAIYTVCGLFLVNKVLEYFSQTHVEHLWGGALRGPRYDLTACATLILISPGLSPASLVKFFLRLACIHLMTALFVGMLLGRGPVDNPAHEEFLQDVAFASALIATIILGTFFAWIVRTIKVQGKAISFALAALFTATLGLAGLFLLRQFTLVAVLWVVFCIVGFPLIFGWLVAPGSRSMTSAQLVDMYKSGIGALPAVFSSAASLFKQTAPGTSKSNGSPLRTKTKTPTRKTPKQANAVAPVEHQDEADHRL